ncbi:MAG: radical SAM protein [Clostridia bacterium]|jgi:putative pyruvate formate lyase activating enzyme|nr:radical SAM protein [Clostridia bacterium]MDE6885306.1 radical SAM protein [Clostridia bacterium]
MEKCYLCPRSCGIDRSKNKGYCNQSGLKVARVSLHKWEEPIISGSNGSGTIFFSGCNLKCVYCQNYDVSHGKGKDITPQILADIFKKIEDSGAHNINLVTPTHFVDDILKAADIYTPKLPVVYNCGGYESLDTLDKLKDLVDIWLPDFKYSDNSLAKKYSNCNDYFEVCTAALIRMRQLCPKDEIADGLMKKGLIIRHLVLPNALQNTKSVLQWIAENLSDDTYVSIMGQYTPFGDAFKFDEINRKLKPLEYKIAVEYAKKFKLFNSFIQSLDSASKEFIPNFDESPIDF